MISNQIVTVEELIEYLGEIAEGYGDIPVVIDSASDKAVESVGRPSVVSVIPAGDVNGFQAYDYARDHDAPQTKVARIN